MKNISIIKDCYGCGLCATVCPRNIINIQLSIDGFYEPRINREELCTNCGLCLSVCSFLDNKISLDSHETPKGYAAWSNDPAVRRKCSSGGVGFELGRYLLSKGYKVCGVRYNPQENRAEHYIATTQEELIPTIGSKYIQSYTVNGFKAVNRKQKYLITGSPCQIDSFRRYIRKYKVEDNFVLMDFFCHGVPSMLMWNKYLREVEKVTGKVTYVSWRNKHMGWHDSFAMGIDGELHGEPINWHDSYNELIKRKISFYNCRLSQGDMFYRMFLSNTCLGKACYDKCKFKYLSSAADIRIGDLWGNKYAYNEEGVSGVLTFTSKGEAILHEMERLTIEPCNLDVLTEGQMKERTKKANLQQVFYWILRKEKASIFDVNRLLFVERSIRKIRGIFNL